MITFTPLSSNRRRSSSVMALSVMKVWIRSSPPGCQRHLADLGGIHHQKYLLGRLNHSLLHVEITEVRIVAAHLEGYPRRSQEEYGGVDIGEEFGRLLAGQGQVRGLELASGGRTIGGTADSLFTIIHIKACRENCMK